MDLQKAGRKRCDSCTVGDIRNTKRYGGIQSVKKIYVVGIGPGEYEQMTIRAVKALESCDVIIGYTVYVDLVREHFAGKEFLTTPMKQEVERCRMAFEKAEEGKTTAMICSGDAGVYGMSGLMLEIGQEYPDVLDKLNLCCQ